MKLFSTRFFLLGAVAALSFTACEKGSEGGFGEAPVAEPGVHVKPSKTKGPPNFIGAIKLAPSFDGASKTVNVALQIKPGFHAYAPGEEIGKPVGITISDTNGWKAAGDVKIPPGKKKDLGTLGTSYVLENMIPISVAVDGGQGEVEGSVSVQVCNESACDRPRKHRFKVAAK